MRVWRWLERITLTAAIAGIGYWAVTTGGPELWQKWANRDFDRRAAAETAASPPEVAVEAPPKKQDVIGRLTIPRLNMNVVVREGADDKTLGLSAGHIPGTALPGHAGNVAIAAHRDTLFRALAKVEKNDVIRLDDPKGGHYYYQVSSTAIVAPTEMSVLKPHATPELTLVTCYPFNYVGSAPERFIVKAQQISDKQAPQAEVVQTSFETPKPTPAPQVKPFRIAPVPYRDPDKTEAPRKTYFSVDLHHSRAVGEGVSLGVTDTDPDTQQVEGWVWLMPERRTVWLRSQAVGDPLAIGGEGERRMVITHVTSNSISGYLVR